MLTIDKTFRDLEKNLSQEKDLYFALFLQRSHSSFLNSIRLGISGACAETFVLCRNVIECALYSLHIEANENLWKIWIDRHENAKSNSESRQNFSYKNLIKTLEDKDKNLARIINILYNNTIDFGAHPNQRAITSNITMNNKEVNGSNLNLLTYFLAKDQTTTAHCHKAILEIGIGALSIFSNVKPSYFKLLGIDETIEKLKYDLGNLIFTNKN